MTDPFSELTCYRAPRHARSGPRTALRHANGIPINSPEGPERAEEGGAHDTP